MTQFDTNTRINAKKILRTGAYGVTGVKTVCVHLRRYKHAGYR